MLCYLFMYRATFCKRQLSSLLLKGHTWFMLYVVVLTFLIFLSTIFNFILNRSCQSFAFSLCLFVRFARFLRVDISDAKEKSQCAACTLQRKKKIDFLCLCKHGLSQCRYSVCRRHISSIVHLVHSFSRKPANAWHIEFTVASIGVNISF